MPTPEEISSALFMGRLNAKMVCGNVMVMTNNSAFYSAIYQM